MKNRFINWLNGWTSISRKKPKNNQMCYVYENNHLGVAHTLVYSERYDGWLDPNDKLNYVDWGEYFTHWKSFRKVVGLEY